MTQSAALAWRQLYSWYCGALLSLLPAPICAVFKYNYYFLVASPINVMLNRRVESLPEILTSKNDPAIRFHITVPCCHRTGFSGKEKKGCQARVRSCVQFLFSLNDPHPLSPLNRRHMVYKTASQLVAEPTEGQSNGQAVLKAVSQTTWSPCCLLCHPTDSSWARWRGSNLFQGLFNNYIVWVILGQCLSPCHDPL